MLESTFHRNLNITVRGGSHEKYMSVSIAGLPSGFHISASGIHNSLARRKSSLRVGETPRREDDDVLMRIKNADKNFDFMPVIDFVTDSNKIYEFRIYNKNFDSSAYNPNVPRPSHVDFPFFVKYGDAETYAGGSIFSGRMTAMTCIVGSIAEQILANYGIKLGSFVHNVGNAFNNNFNMLNPSSASLTDEMKEKIVRAKRYGESYGASLYVFAKNLHAGIGLPLFNNLKATISSLIFAIPGVIGVEFGAGFEASKRYGSQNNDEYYISSIPKDNLNNSTQSLSCIKTYTNNQGGLIGGLTTGMPLICHVAFKPISSISKEQRSVNLKTLTNETISIKGMHDACILPRGGQACIASLAIALLDSLLADDFFNTSKSDTTFTKPALSSRRKSIDDIDKQLVELLEKRLLHSRAIGLIKKEGGIDVTDESREREILKKIPCDMHDIFHSIFALSKSMQ